MKMTRIAGTAREMTTATRPLVRVLLLAIPH
jgi:hypothetical protein